MEPAAEACVVPYNFQLANWTIDMEPAAWSPAGFAAESAESGEIDGGTGSWIQTCVPNDSGGGGQLVEYYAAATPTPQHYYAIIEKEAQAEPCEVVLHDMEMEVYNHAIRVALFERAAHKLEQAADKLEADTHPVEYKMHRYPQSIQDLGEWYTVPRVVAIGPYHHGRPELKEAEQVKRVAAYHCIAESGCLPRRLQDIYDKVVSAADEDRGFYDQDAIAAAGIGCDDFRHMMFFDACFLVQYMAWYTGLEMPRKRTDPSLLSFFDSHRSDIHHDVWQLENQLPWTVVQAVMGFLPDVNLDKFVAPWIHLFHDRQDFKEENFALDDSYKPPHLLGLLRYHIVGKSRKLTPLHKNYKLESLSFSMSAVELAQIGVSLTATKAGGLADMGLVKNEILFAELSMAPLSLDYTRASQLVNMAAFEMCTIPSFMDADEYEDNAVCSYLLLLCTLVQREDDVHELRTQGVLEGGVGFNNKQTLEFFTSLQILPPGLIFASTMIDIERYTIDRKLQTKGLRFYHRNYKTISAIGAFVTLIGTLLTISGKIKALIPAH